MFDKSGPPPTNVCQTLLVVVEISNPSPITVINEMFDDRLVTFLLPSIFCWTSPTVVTLTSCQQYVQQYVQQVRCFNKMSDKMYTNRISNKY